MKSELPGASPCIEEHRRAPSCTRCSVPVQVVSWATTLGSWATLRAEEPGGGEGRRDLLLSDGLPSDGHQQSVLLSWLLLLWAILPQAAGRTGAVTGSQMQGGCQPAPRHKHRVAEVLPRRVNRTKVRTD